MGTSGKSTVNLTTVERHGKFLEGGAIETEDPETRFCPVCGCKGKADVPGGTIEEWEYW